MITGKIEPQGMGPILPGKGKILVDILESRNGRLTTLELDDGTSIPAFNCTWGRDFGELWEHIYINCSPEMNGEEV